MRTVRLFGELGRKFGRVHKFLVNTPAEAVRALCANFPEFQAELQTAHHRNVGYKVFNGRYQLENAEEARDPSSGDIKIVPVIMGANAGARIIIGVVLVAVGVVAGATGYGAAASPYLISAGVGLILGGVIELLSPVPKVKGPEEREENRPSYLFNGPVNTTAQGHPVPIGYGRVLVGGGIVSAGISIDQIMAGYRRVQVERTQIGETYIMSTGEVYEAIAPANHFRKELISFQNDIPHDFNPEVTYDLYTYKFYYYETITELTPT